MVRRIRYYVYMESKHSIIFLDVDGVLNCSKTRARCQNYVGIENKKVELLKKIVDRTGAKIVLTSTWRVDWYKESWYKIIQSAEANYLDRKLKSHNLYVYDKIDYADRRRGEGIIKYVWVNEIRNFVILDDESFDFGPCKLLKYLVKTAFDEGGLNGEHVGKAIKILQETNHV